MTAFWDIAPCNLVVDRHFGDTKYLPNQGDDLSQSTQRSIPEGCHHTRHRQNLKCHLSRLPSQTLIHKIFIFIWFYWLQNVVSSFDRTVGVVK
jgi:hypothetical protein